MIFRWIFNKSFYFILVFLFGDVGGLLCLFVSKKTCSAAKGHGELLDKQQCMFVLEYV